MPMLPNGRMLPYGPQTGAAPLPAAGAPGAGMDLQALLGSPEIMQGKPGEGGPIVDPARPVAPAEVAPMPVAQPAPAAPQAPPRGPLSGGPFPVRMPFGARPGAPASPFPTAGHFRRLGR